MRPHHDPLPARKQPERTLLRRLAEQAMARKRERPGGNAAGGDPVPVEPNRPNNLTGGAAALEFDE